MTGVFCNSAIKAAENDHDLAVQSLVQMRKELKDQVMNLFDTIDERGLGQLTISEFERHFADDAVKAFFEVLKIGAVDAWTLFTSLDKDGDHTVNVDEFVERCPVEVVWQVCRMVAGVRGVQSNGKQLRKIEEAQQFELFVFMELKVIASSETEGCAHSASLRHLAIITAFAAHSKAAEELGNLKELDEVLHKHTAEADISCGSSAVFYRAVCAHLDTRFEKLEMLFRRPLNWSMGPQLNGDDQLTPEQLFLYVFVRVMTAESGPLESVVESLPNSSQPGMRPSYIREDSPSSYEMAKKTGEAVTQAFSRIGGASKELTERRLGPAFSVWYRCRQWAAAIVNSQIASIFFAMVVMSNSVYLGVHLSWSSQNTAQTANPVFLGMHVAYSVLFTLEALLHLMAVGFTAYICGPSWAWNWLDIFVVTSSWIELAVDIVSPDHETMGANSNLRIMRLLRLGRLVRVVRIVRVVKLFRALRTLVYSLLGTLKSLFWSFLLLALIIYIFGILFTDVVLNHLWEQAEQGISVDTDTDEVRFYFGTLYVSIITLFRSISNGITWNKAADALEPVGMFWVQVFHFYVAFCSFALLNVMTGVFCNSAIKAAERDHDMVLQSMMQTRKEYQDVVSNLFKKIDERGLGHLTITEFERHFDDDSVQALFEYLQIGAMDAWTMFISLDKDGDHTINVDEFTERCIQLHGPARSADLFAVRQNCAKLTKDLRKMDETQERIEMALAMILQQQAAIAAFSV
ncbi:Scn11a [Symbiodinium pilosum]|uniref:Scn11a protein n=1 Tax=Symbiodinium pilosum TaxID=2952 RepID=A0A812WIL1_SYMPI|nr:Scn11a [Symbiodinium pilosum]